MALFMKLLGIQSDPDREPCPEVDIHGARWRLHMVPA